ncbi:head completion/stabilization protein [Sphingomonas aracearum]|uniref:Head completion/stabilization protein n=1 Tax=Sphingomonas aracearum TaxID=2283317 RepID=A0A369VT26_9SPHN|nr:head completion/stabilization protein [Sphingomonas aracearum]RDE04697.1 head completion/stabilization protein [Sphingomonas aracearum]
MSGFSVVNAAPARAEATIANGDWYPDIDPVRFRAEQRVLDAVTPERARQALVAGIISVNRDLQGWAAGWRSSGRAALADVPADEIDGESVLLQLYRRAVFTVAKAELVERYRDMDITGAGQRNADALDPSVGELRRDSLHAIRDMLGVGRTTVELI